MVADCSSAWWQIVVADRGGRSWWQIVVADRGSSYVLVVEKAQLSRGWLIGSCNKCEKHQWLNDRRVGKSVKGLVAEEGNCA